MNQKSHTRILLGGLATVLVTLGCYRFAERIEPMNHSRILNTASALADNNSGIGGGTPCMTQAMKVKNLTAKMEKGTRAC